MAKLAQTGQDEPGQLVRVEPGRIEYQVVASDDLKPGSPARSGSR